MAIILELVAGPFDDLQPIISKPDLLEPSKVRRFGFRGECCELRDLWMLGREEGLLSVRSVGCPTFRKNCSVLSGGKIKGHSQRGRDRHRQRRSGSEGVRLESLS